MDPAPRLGDRLHALVAELAASDGLGIAVGEDPTNADYRIQDPDAVADRLSWLADYGVAFLERDPQTISLPA